MAFMLETEASGHDALELNSPESHKYVHVNMVFHLFAFNTWKREYSMVTVPIRITFVIIKE